MLAPLVLWTASRFAAFDFRWELVAVVVLAAVLASAGPRSKRLFDGLYPIALLGLVYDAMRFVKNLGLTPERVHVCDLRAIDMQIATISQNGVPGSVHDWLQAHASPALDLACAVPYAVFIYVVLGFAVFLYAKDYERMRAFGWTFLLVNLAGFATYHLYPAAPPWYFHAHGCAVDLAAHASEGPNLARVDAMLGVPYFASFYRRSNDVFGAMPSLHVAYPMLVLLNGWHVFKTPGRVLSVLFLASMCFAALYLDHHWIADVVVGLAYTVAISSGVLALTRYRAPSPPSFATSDDVVRAK